MSTRNTRSMELHRKAKQMMPGGVSSPVRAFSAVGGAPFFVEVGHGPYIYDVDGNRYVDLVCSWGPLILGHAHPAVVAAVTDAAQRGLSFGACCEPEVELAELVLRHLDGAEMIRFVNSGTEAVMSAARVARAATGRPLILKFSGCYHGHADQFLVSAGSGLATFGTPSSAGVTKEAVGTTVVVPLDSVEALEKAFQDHGERIAAAVIEGVPANAGLLPQKEELMKALERLCREYGSLLIVDEVITGFRLGPGAAASRSYEVKPDLVTLGKVIGGGMPVGVYAGRRELMSLVAPEGPVYQAGTLAGNPIAMTAGAETLRQLLADGGKAYSELDSLGLELESGLNAIIEEAGLGWSVVRRGSILWLYADDGAPPRSVEDISSAHVANFKKLFGKMLENGVFLPPSPYEVWFLSTAHGPRVLEQVVEAFREALRSW